MTIRSHPSEATLLAYAAGTLATGASLAVAAHLAFCKQCRKPIAAWEMAAGAMLDTMPESELAGDALARALQRTESGESSFKRSGPRPNLSGVELPAPICTSGVEKRRRVAPGIWKAAIPVATNARARAYVLGLAPNRKIPLHGHGGPEMICVLKGSFSDASGEYGEGDFVEVDGDSDHRPVAGRDGECICIVAEEGPPRMRGIFGWLLQPFVD